MERKDKRITKLMQLWLKRHTTAVKGDDPIPNPQRGGKMAEIKSDNAERTEDTKVTKEDDPETKVTKNIVEDIKEDANMEEAELPIMSGICWEPMPSIAVIAKKKAGKTNFVLQLVRQNNERFDQVFVVSSTAKITKEWDNLFPGSDERMKIVDDIDDEELDEFLELRKALYPDDNKKILLILDDFIGMPKLKLRGKVVKKLVTTARHYGVGVIMLSQKFRACPDCIRTNCEYVVLYNTNANEINKIYDEYAPTAVKKAEFRTIVSKIVRRKGYGLIYNLDQQQWFLFWTRKFEKSNK